MSEIALLPDTLLTLTANEVLVHVEPHISLLNTAVLTLKPYVLKVITEVAWPVTLPQYFLADGSYSESPFPTVIETPTDSGIRKTRKRFTGKFLFVSGTIWLSNQSQLDIFESFYYGSADQGNSFFNMPVPTGGTMVVRFVPGSLVIISDGGVGWKASFKLQQQPTAL